MTQRSHIASFLRFIVVGGSFSLGYAILTAGLIRFVAAPPLITSIVVYLICIPLAFLAQRRFAFQTHRSRPSAMLIYGITQVASLAVVSTITARFVTRNFVLDAGLFLVTAGAAAMASYLICRFVIFRYPSGSDAQ